jgi:integrase
MRKTRRPPRKARLTERLLSTLKPEAVAYPVWDQTLPGFAIRVQPTGSKAWYAVYSRRGTPRWLHLGNAGHVDLATARKSAAEMLLQVATGKDPAAERQAQRSSGTFGELAEQYVERHAKRKNKSWQHADRLVRRYLLPAWGKLPSASITRADAQALLDGITAPVLSNQVKASGSAIFTWGAKKEIISSASAIFTCGTKKEIIITSNPFRAIDSHPTVDRERVLSDSEVPLVWSAFDSVGLLPSSALKLILLTGQRPGEVSNMRREHIVDGWWTLPGEPVPALGWPGTKNKQNHRVWLPTAAREIIAELGDGFVLPGERGGGVKRLDAAMRDICAKLGVADKVTPHDLRRTFSSKVTGLGFGRDAMNRVTNHREGGIADVYDRHEYADENRRILETVSASIMTLVEGKPTGKVVPIRR